MQSRLKTNALFSIFASILFISQTRADVFAVLTNGGTRYELSNDSVTSCVKLPAYAHDDWKLAVIKGRWTGTVKSCWRKVHYAKERINVNALPPGHKDNFAIQEDPPHWVTVPEHDVILVCLPFVKSEGMEPSCQEIDPKYFIAVDSLPKPAF
jgi:hypothetical protein